MCKGELSYIAMYSKERAGYLSLGTLNLTTMCTNNGCLLLHFSICVCVYTFFSIFLFLFFFLLHINILIMFVFCFSSGPDEVLKFQGNDTVIDHFKLVLRDGNSLLIGAR